MVMGGLWHGPQSRFLLWGTLHGITLALTHAVKDIRQSMSTAGRDREGGESPPASTWSPVFKAGAWFFTFSLVSFLWVFFEAENSARAMEIFRAIFAFNTKGMNFDPWVLPAVVAGLSIQFLGPFSRDLFYKIQRSMPVPLQAALLALICVVIIKIGPSGIPPFIYFQF